MLLILKDNQVIVDGNPYAENIKINIQWKDRLARVKLIYLTNEPTPIDLALAFELPKLGISSISLDIEGQELLRDIYFRINLVFSIVKRRTFVRGTFGTKKIDTTISNVVELLTIIRSMVIMQEKISN